MHVFVDMFCFVGVFFVARGAAFTFGYVFFLPCLVSRVILCDRFVFCSSVSGFLDGIDLIMSSWNKEGCSYGDVGKRRPGGRWAG